MVTSQGNGYGTQSIATAGAVGQLSNVKISQKEGCHTRFLRNSVTYLA